MGEIMQSIGTSLQAGLSFGDIGIVRILITMLLAFGLGLFVFFIYRRTFAGVMYSRNFGVSLVMLSMITALIILPITSNLTLSMGMVGALSIVRFRTAVKDPIDTVYMFWAIAVGLMLGARFYLPAIFATLVVGLMLILLNSVKIRSTMPYLLVLRYAENANEAVYALMGRLPQGKIKSKTVTQSGVELTVEMRLRESDITVVDRFLAISGVYDAAVIAYSGDIVA